MKNLGIIVGSLRKESFNMKLAKYIKNLFPDNITISIIDISKLEIYNEDLENTPTASWIEFRETMKNVDSLLFITPEYNRSIPGVLKNALDVGSRPYGGSIWAKKPGAIISASPGGMGAFGANHHLRQCLVFLDVYTMQQPEMYIGNIGSIIDESGNIKDENTISFFQSFVDNFILWTKNFN